MKIVYLLLFMTLPNLQESLECPKLNLPSIESFDCFCETRFKIDKRGGIEMTCMEKDNLVNIKFIINYAINKIIKIECSSMTSPYAPGLFSNFNASEIVAFEFDSCALPNMTFSEILNGYQVHTLKFESRMNVSLEKIKYFTNLDNLKVLTFQRNGLSTIPADLFQNLKSLNTLRLNENSIQNLGEYSFIHFTNLTLLELGGNLIHSLHGKTFSGLHNLLTLYLYQNKLANLSIETFQGLYSLKTLDLSGNLLGDLPSEIFNDLSAIERINLRRNRLTNLPESLFSKTVNLLELDFSSNSKLDNIPGELFSNLSKFQNINMARCNITAIPKNLFSRTKKLVKIVLNNNRISEVPNELLKHNPELKDFLMEYNHLKTIPPDLFRDKFKLEVLSLNKNSLTYIHNDAFTDLVKLKDLNLASNNLTKLEDLFQNIQRLETLDLSKNRLSEIKSFGNIRSLTKIDVSKNRLKTMPDIAWNIYLGIEEVNLEHNNITRLSIPKPYSDKVQIKLGWNEIESIDMDDIILYIDINKYPEPDPPGKKQRLGEPSLVYLYPNPILCDCQIYPFITYITKEDVLLDGSLPVKFPLSRNLTCSQPSYLRGKRLISLSVTDFVCYVSEDCPPQCRCYITAGDLKLVVNCSDKGLVSFPTMTPWNPTVLDISRNNLNSLDALEESIWQNLTEIYLDGNDIADFGEWNFKQNLHVLSLKHNSFQFLPTDIMNYTTRKLTLHMSLSDNPWLCNCEALKLKSWLAENYGKIRDIEKVYCEYQMKNGTLTHENILQVKDDILCPPDTWPHRRQLIIVSVIGVLLALMLFVILILYYRNRRILMAYFYFHFNFVFFCLYNEEELDEDKMFDAFVSYSSNDSDVMLALLNELENKEPSFKLCIHERDWVAGNFISLNIANSVQYSKRTIIVLTKDFLESVWFQVEFQTAYHQMIEEKINRLIVIIKGDLPPKETLDKNLQAILSTKTYLVWGERWFWEKLRYAMPHKKRPLSEVNQQIILRPKAINPDLIKSVEDKMSSFICAQNTKIEENPSRRKLSTSSMINMQNDSGIYSIESESLEDIVSESGPI